MFAATIKGRPVRLVPTEPLAPVDIAAILPEAEPEFTGQGESVGCDGISGWVLDTKHPGQNQPLELYGDDILLAAGIAENKREDGRYEFRIPIPKRLLDGRPHPVNVRFAGSSTQVDQAWGTITCRPAAR